MLRKCTRCGYDISGYAEELTLCADCEFGTDSKGEWLASNSSYQRNPPAPYPSGTRVFIKEHLDRVSKHAFPGQVGRTGIVLAALESTTDNARYPHILCVKWDDGETSNLNQGWLDVAVVIDTSDIQKVEAFLNE